ncbi:MAG: rRNA maturation RNase YbeY [Granulosicoccaceae bacterium]
MANAEMGTVLTVLCNSEAIDPGDSSIYMPTAEQLELWTNKAVKETSIEADYGDQLELSIAYVDSDGMQALNKQYRDSDRPTNVLTFSAIEELAHPSLEVTGLLGDIVLCPKIIQDEAVEQGKPIEHHFAHLVVHGVLHLGGMDHHAQKEAEAMEQAEIQILSSLDIPDPYNSVFSQSK